MSYYSWQLTIVVLVCFLPLVISLRFFAERLSDAYDIVRRTVGEMLAVIAEPVVGASVVRAYAIERRTQARVDAGIKRNLRRQHQRAEARRRDIRLGRCRRRPGQRRRHHASASSSAWPAACRWAP